jgi:hypothetical protein
MRKNGYAELTTTEFPDALQFSVVRHCGWHEVILEPTLYMAMALSLVSSHFPKSSEKWVGIMAYVMTICFVYFTCNLFSLWLFWRNNEISVTNNEIEATGNLGRLFSKKVVIPWSNVNKIGWQERGLCVLRKVFWWPSVCILQGVDEEQVKTIRGAIFKKFPYFVNQIFPDIAEADKYRSSLEIGPAQQGDQTISS